ncbi:MAG TPA: hypothetical protein PLU50_05235, partial [Pseudobdellovibrionaceae bacterium]|nr:hypothetical protein [Pseudobdellovibrionaceae bacterium]
HLYIYSNYQDIENHLYWLHDRKIETDELALVTLGVVLSKAMVKTGTEQKQAQLAVMNGINQTLKSISDEEGRFFNRTLTLSELARLVRICYEISAAPHDLTRFHLSMKDLFKDQIPVSVLAQLGRVFKVQYQKRSGLQGNVPNLTRLTREQLAGLLYRPESMAISISDYLMDQKFISEMQKNEEAPSPGILSRLMVTAFGEEESTPTLSHTEASRRNLDRMFEKIYFSSNGAK